MQHGRCRGPSRKCRHVAYGSFASNLVCPRHVGVISEVPVARFCRFRITSLATFDTTLRLRGLSSFCMDHLSHRPSRSWSARSKSLRWRNSVAVFFVTKFQDQVTSATVESPEPRHARNALSDFEFNQASLARS